jgi:hypothetical protein
MAQFIAFDRNVQVNGRTVCSVIDGMGAFQHIATKILTENGIVDPMPDQWYSQQAWLNSFKAIAKKVGARTLYQIGMRIPENADFPDHIDSVEKALFSIDVAYHMNHRGGEIGHYQFKRTGSHSGKMTCKNPYPCDFDRGIIDAMCKKFKPRRSIYVCSKHDETQSCRKEGGDSCTYLIRW